MNKLLIVLLIFFFSLSLRLWNLNQMGRTWDEAAYVEVGNKFVKLIAKGDFLNNYFYEWTNEPPLARYVYGLFSTLDEERTSNNQTSFKYDYTYSRFSSAVISSLAVVAVVLLCMEFISLKIGVYAGVILSMLPIFLGLSQIATLESLLIFTFTSSVYAFLRFLKRTSYKNALIVGIFLGLAALSKLTNLLLIPLFLSIFIIWKKYSGFVFDIKDFTKKVSSIIFTSVLTFIVIWPMPFFNIISVAEKSYELRSRLGATPSIEVFFGKLIHVPVFYFFVFFLITTPILVLVLFFIGSKYISDYGISFNKLKSVEKKLNKKWIFYSLIIWFLLPFIQSFYNFRHHGIRFIIEIYAPLTIISALGLDYVLGKLAKDLKIKIFLIFLLFFYMFLSLYKISPYYLDYFNEVIGGAKTVYEKRLFQVGWWGQGLREAGYYLSANTKKGSTIGLAVSPIHSFPKLTDFKVKEYSEKEEYDYVVVSYFHILREGFDDKNIRKKYKLIYSVKADNAVLVFVYKRI